MIIDFNEFKEKKQQMCEEDELYNDLENFFLDWYKNHRPVSHPHSLEDLLKICYCSFRLMEGTINLTKLSLAFTPKLHEIMPEFKQQLIPWLESIIQELKDLD